MEIEERLEVYYFLFSGCEIHIAFTEILHYDKTCL
jgi:hypothetical protein